MATGIADFDKTLIGVEASPGGSTDIPTTYWRGTGVIKDEREIRYPKQKVGRLGGTTRTYTPKTGGNPVLEDDLAYEMFGHIANAAFYLTTPTTDTGSGYIRQWSAQSASSDPVSSSDLGTLVIESGDNIQAERARYCYVRDYTLGGREGEAVTITANFGSQAPETATFTAVGDTDFNNPYETILNNTGVMYIDPSTDTPGTTQKSTTLIEWSLKHTTGWVPIPAKDGRTDFSDIKHIGDDIMLDVTFEHNSVAVAEKAAWRNETERVIRLKFTGTIALASAGAYTYNTLVIDLYGKWDKFGAEGLEDANGDNTYKGTFRVAYSQLANKKLDITLVTDQVTLP